MDCPKCHSSMEQVVHDGVEVDRCSLCHGIWFDATEADALRNRKAAAAIDTGFSDQGERMNIIDRYTCPRCSAAMVRMVDAKQPHIWYEQCSSCGGSFFDAGEFTDLSERTLSDLFKRLSTPERP